MLGQSALMFESLAVSLVFLAILAAVSGGWRWRLLRILLLLLVAVVTWAGFSGQAFMAYLAGFRGLQFYLLLVHAAAYAAGSIWIFFSAVRRNRNSSELRCRNWPIKKLGAALLFSLSAFAITVWMMSLELRHRVAILRAEAAKISVATAPSAANGQDDAAKDYYEALRLMGEEDAWPSAYRDKWNDWISDRNGRFDAQDAELKDFLRQQSTAVKRLREGGAKTWCRFDRNYERPKYVVQLPENEKLRQAARLLSLDARFSSATGDLKSALDDCRAIFSMAHHVARDPFLISVLTSVAIEGLGMSTLEAVLKGSTPSENDLPADLIDPEFLYAPYFRNALRMEEALGIAAFCDIAEVRRPARADASESQKLFTSRSYRILLLPPDIDSYRSRMKRWQLLATKPLFEARSELDDADRSTKNDPGILTRLMAAGLSNYWKAIARGDAQRDLVVLAVATYRFKARHQRLPEALGELTPDFITAIPIDPFDGKPMRMTKSNGGMVLYSIDTDRTDNGGTPYQTATETGDIVFTIK